jgi:FkbM family methyltransferase
MILQIIPGVWGIEGSSHHNDWIRQAGKLAHDESTLPAIRKYIPQGGVVVDGGGHLGTHSIFYLDRVGPEGKVIAFEPMPETFRCLVRNCPNAVAYQLALGREYGTSWMRHDQNYGGAFLDKRNDGTDPVFIVPLDELELQRLDFLKVDVEGCEIHTLVGATHTIKRCRPTMLIEVNDGALRRQAATPSELYAMIESLGYRYEYLFPNHHMNMPQTDVICFPLDRQPAQP